MLGTCTTHWCKVLYLGLGYKYLNKMGSGVTLLLCIKLTRCVQFHKIVKFQRQQKQLLHIFHHPADPGGVTYILGEEGFPTQLDIFRRSGAKGCLDSRFRVHPQPHTVPNCKLCINTEPKTAIKMVNKIQLVDFKNYQQYTESTPPRVAYPITDWALHCLTAMIIQEQSTSKWISHFTN